MFCSLGRMAGEPYRGIHAARIPLVDVALWDVVFTVVGALVVARWGGWRPAAVVVAALCLSVPAHLLFCVRTRAVAALLGEDRPLPRVAAA